MTRDWVRLWLRYTADDLGDSGFDIYYGYGRINARKAVEQTPPDHDLLILDWEKPPYVEPNNMAVINTTVLNFGVSDESNIRVQLLVNGVAIDSALISHLARGAYVTVSCSWTPTSEGEYRVESYIVPVPYETITGNNILEGLVYVGFPIRAVVLDSAGTDFGEVVSTWEILNTKWPIFGTKLIHVDYTTLNIDDITYEDIAATEADVLIISCAFEWEFTDSEINAIKRYVYEGHGLIATAGTLYSEVPNNNKLAPLFGLNEAVSWEVTGTDLLHILDQAHPLFENVPDPYTFPEVSSSVPSDDEWNSNELSGGTYLALGQYKESAVVVFRGLVYISPWLEIIPAYYHFHLQLLYNAIAWSSYQKPKHELVVSLESPPYLEPGESAMLNATVCNMGLNVETNVQLRLQIDSIVVKSTTIPQLPIGASATISYSWTPTVEATYNVTAYAPPIPYEEYISNNVEVKMVYVRLIKGYVTFEEAHLPAYTINSNPAYDIAGGYREFANYLTFNGYIVSTIDPGTTIDSGVLATVELLVIVAPQDSYSASELDAIENWVKGGGNLLLISDWGSFGVEARSIAERFSINLAGDLIHDSDENVGYTAGPYYDGSNLLPHPITIDVTRVELYSGDGIITAPADEVPIIVTDLDGTATWDDGSPALGVSVMSAFDGSTAGSGRLVIVTDSNIWDSANDFDNDGNVGFYDSDNQILALNTINWFVTQFEHELAVSLEVPDFLEPYYSSLLNATVYNHGLSNETNVELQLMINGVMVNFTTVPNLLSGTSYTINYYWTPTEEAVYNVTAYAPPLPEENFTANNIVTRFVAVKPIIGYVLFDQTHGTDSITEYSIWTANLTSRGYLVDTCKSTPIIFTVLAGYDVFVIPQALDRYSPAELEAIRNFVYGGGGLLVIGDDEPVIYTDLTGFAGISWFSDGTSGVTTDITPHEVTAGVASMYLESPITAMEVTGMAQDLVRDPAGGIMLAVSEHVGRVIGFADENSLWDYSIVEEDNLLLANNMIDWLLGVQYEHDLAVLLEAPSHLEPGESTLLNATVLNRGLSNETDVRLQLLINETLVESVEIPQLLTDSYDTLSHFWIAPTVEGVYNITAYAPPVSGENFTLNNVRSLMVLVQTLPNIIIVADNDGAHAINGTSLPEFESVVTAMGYDYYIWNESSMGNPSLDFLTKFELVIWTCGDCYDTAVDSEDAETLELYLANGGNILLEGEDIAYDHHDDSFMINVAHAIYQIDDTEAPGLTVSNLTHPVTLGLPTNFTWLTDPPYDDGVYPTNGGAEVIKYTGTNWTAVTVFKGANNGSVVYYAFPLYCLAQSERETLASNSINWLLPTIEGDLNDDGVVNILDLGIVAFAYGSYLGHPRWNPAADFDGNGIINILDVVKIAKNFGKTL